MSLSCPRCNAENPEGKFSCWNCWGPLPQPLSEEEMAAAPKGKAKQPPAKAPKGKKGAGKDAPVADPFTDANFDPLAESGVVSSPDASPAVPETPVELPFAMNPEPAPPPAKKGLFAAKAKQAPPQTEGATQEMPLEQNSEPAPAKKGLFGMAINTKSSPPQAKSPAAVKPLRGGKEHGKFGKKNAAPAQAEDISPAIETPELSAPFNDTAIPEMPAAPRKRGGMLPVILLMALILLGGGGFAVWKFVLPKFLMPPEKAVAQVAQQYLDALGKGDTGAIQQLSSPASKNIKLPTWFTIVSGTMSGPSVVTGTTATVPISLTLQAAPGATPALTPGKPATGAPPASPPGQPAPKPPMPGKKSALLPLGDAPPSALQLAAAPVSVPSPPPAAVKPVTPAAGGAQPPTPPAPGAAGAKSTVPPPADWHTVISKPLALQLPLVKGDKSWVIDQQALFKSIQDTLTKDNPGVKFPT